VDAEHGVEWKVPGHRQRRLRGTITQPALAAAVSRGYAAASTDTGHTTTDASWALGHPEKIVDYGNRAIHEMTEKAKSIVSAFLRKWPEAFLLRQLLQTEDDRPLMEAQRYPNDYDGLIAGAPANYFTHIPHRIRVESAGDPE